ncbi:hypothetical protein LguiA_026789 [Lonicera macranthoides]
MGNKSILLVCILVSAILMGHLVRKRPAWNSEWTPGLIRIQGTVYCTANGNVCINGSSTPIFSNALVQLRCGNGNVVSSVTTNNSGLFLILLDPLQFVLSSVSLQLQHCRQHAALELQLKFAINWGLNITASTY